MSVDLAVAEAVLAIEAALATAVIRRDRAAAEALLHPEFAATGHAGNVVDRSQYLDIHFAPERRFTRFEPQDQRLFAAGEAVAVVGQVTMVNGNLPFNPPPARYVALYLPSPDKAWWLRYWQETPIDPAARF